MKERRALDLSPLALHNRLSTVETVTDEVVRDIKAVQEWRQTIEESTQVGKELVEVGKALLTAMGWVKVVSRWIISIV